MSINYVGPPEPEDQTPDRALVRRFLLTIAAMLTFICIAFGLIIWIVTSAEDREDRDDARVEAAEDAEDDQADEDSNFLSCLRGNEFRELMKLQTSLAYGNSGGTDLSQLPSFPLLDDATQAWVLELKEASKSASGAGTSTRDMIIGEINKQIRDCPAEYPDHTPGLKLDHTVKAPST